ncbi:DUF3667 domain-containing protein [Stenotrophomonas sp. NLF4-10]|uniref:DUF3667 domain-containing protein n=1 Tax=Stenotrophomonas sp. NLF4-10 TaxID=2918754 RepID=UPI001EFAFB7B|nr:DUF3667 domain-containing protein [Stenotrophomonas sp. NLF4-10]MCG8275066.1 DUF3667 domain-containing protein [Stenotrophomonas sp. NLF4-10]
MNPTRDNPPAVAAAPEHGSCENCHAALNGHYCHHCGQSAHNPLKHFGHAVEEVFESFWHLDGRIFRTLRDLLVPGRVAVNFLRGHRVGYVQPLRLFVILTLFTFFVGKLMLHAEGAVVFDRQAGLFAPAQTADEVERLRAAQVAEMERALGGSPGDTASLALAMTAINTAAARRLAELEDTRSTSGSAVARAGEAAARASDGRTGQLFSHDVNGKPWDPQTNPVVLAGWPGFADRWLNQRMANTRANLERMDGNPVLFLQAVLTALPGALFLLMPVFALVLRVAYLRRPTGYLEHLVVALYSHSWLMLVLLATFAVAGISGAIGNSVVSTLGGWLYVLLWLAVPVYLFWMQQRVYGGNPVLTMLRYLFIGGVYLFLVIAVVMYAVLAGVSA